MSADYSTNSPDRERVIEQALHATTPDEIRAAWRALQAWRQDHPDDHAIRSAFGMLYRLADGNGMIPPGEVMFPLEEPATAAAA